jgi:hypothetical protein
MYYYLERDHLKPERKYWLMPNGKWMASNKVLDGDLEVKGYKHHSRAINAARKINKDGVYEVRVMS